MASARYQQLNNMRGLDESTDVLLRVGQSATEQVRHGWQAFVNFAARDNVLEVALGLMSENSTRPQVQ
jgi:large conductance mechanosensitive channel